MPVPGLDHLRVAAAQGDQVVASGTVRALDHNVLGAVHQPRPAPLWNGEASDPTPTAPRLGEHTDDVLREAGWSTEEIAQTICWLLSDDATAVIGEAVNVSAGQTMV